MTGDTVTILLIDDDTVDIMTVRRSFRDLKISNPIVEARDGLEGLERLRGQNGFEKVPLPRLVLLDLSMPRMGGIEFLTQVRADPVLCSTLIFVMTTSELGEDRSRVYDENVAGFVPKHRPGQSFTDSIRMLEHYCQTIEFPV